MWSNTNANHLELFKLIFFTFSCYFLFVISVTFLREQISCLNEWTEFDLKRSEHKTEFCFLIPRAGDKIEVVYTRLLLQQGAGPTAFPLVIGGEAKNGVQGTFMMLCSAGFGMLS